MPSQPAGIAIIFDLDGVLVDVSSSYRKAIEETVQFFTGKKVKANEIQELKENGGYNNDWDLTEELISKRGKTIPKSGIIERFQEFYIGVGDKRGFIQNEKWLISNDLLSQVHKKRKLGIVTGRPKEEAIFVLKKFDAEKFFDTIIAMEDYPKEKAKPDPYPIKLALKRMNEKDGIYIGDSVDDVVAAKRAQIEAIGCLPLGIHSNKLKNLLLECGAEIVLDDINDIGKLFL